MVEKQKKDLAIFIEKGSTSLPQKYKETKI